MLQSLKTNYDAHTRTYTGGKLNRNLSFILGDECGRGELLARRAGRWWGVCGGVTAYSPRPGRGRAPMGGVYGPGVVSGCFSTCSALSTTASRLWYLQNTSQYRICTSNKRRSTIKVEVQLVF